ncbi:MAG: 3-oxoacyl-ACP reductase FabG [Planctomycetota bacterium]|nr:3-oxoacyl-ACP reductase FabG [Planctomycetota bacterium]
MRLKDKVCVVTGSSRGIGAAIAKAYAREGAHVVVTYRQNREQAEEVARACGSELCQELDVCSRESIRSCFAAVAERYGRVDVLVNNAGINITGDFDEISEEDWDAVVDTDLKGVFLCCQEVLPHLVDNGRVVNIGSLSGEYGGPRTPSYAAAKAGVMALTHCMARFVANRGITVNCLSPGVIDSELTEQTMPAFLKEKILPLILLGRFGRYDEVTEAAVFLASDGASYITAQTLSVNGGAWVR